MGWVPVAAALGTVDSAIARKVWLPDYLSLGDAYFDGKIFPYIPLV